jgi:hypothetical protein
MTSNQFQELAEYITAGPMPDSMKQRAQGRSQKRTQLKTKLGGVTAWNKRNKKGGKFMAIKTRSEEFKGVRIEKQAGKEEASGLSRSASFLPGPPPGGSGSASIKHCRRKRDDA